MDQYAIVEVDWLQLCEASRLAQVGFIVLEFLWEGYQKAITY